MCDSVARATHCHRVVLLFIAIGFHCHCFRIGNSPLIWPCGPNCPRGHFAHPPLDPEGPHAGPGMPGCRSSQTDPGLPRPRPAWCSDFPEHWRSVQACFLLRPQACDPSQGAFPASGQGPIQSVVGAMLAQRPRNKEGPKRSLGGLWVTGGRPPGEPREAQWQSHVKYDGSCPSGQTVQGIARMLAQHTLRREFLRATPRNRQLRKTQALGIEPPLATIEH